MTKQMTVTEARFRSGSGVRYLADGVTIRCQAMSKRKLRILRAKSSDYTSDNEVFWPEAQCSYAACIGHYACKLHGGETPKSDPTIYDLVPVDLGEKLRIVSQNPDYISRKSDIELLLARKMQLLEKLASEEGGEDAWEEVSAAISAINSGNIVEAKDLLISALNSQVQEKEVWSEILKNDSMIKDLTTTQVKTAKELKLMATMEQVQQLSDSFYKLILDVINLYVEPNRQMDGLNYVQHRLAGLVNIRVPQISSTITK